MDDRKRILIEHSIKERQDIVDRYRDYGILDRDDAISKIYALRMTDPKVRSAVEIDVVVHPNRIPLENCTDEQLAMELQNQILVLEMELTEIV